MADKTISSLPALATVSKEDVLLVVDNPAGTPVNRKISIESFFSNVEPIVFFSNTQGASTAETASVVFKGGVGIKKNLIIDGDIEIRGATVSGTTKLGAVSNDITLTDENIFDLANTANPFRTIYVGNVASGQSGILNVNSNTTNFYSNTNFIGSNLIISSQNLNLHSNTLFTANVYVNDTSNKFVIDSDNLIVSSEVTINGNDLDINSNVNLTKSLTNTGRISLFDNDTFIANSDTFYAYGNLVLGMYGNDGNPKGTTTNVYISGTNTYIKSDITVKGTKTEYFSNLYVNSVNTSIISTNTYIDSNISQKGIFTLVGNAKYTSNKFEVNGSNNYFIGKLTTKNEIHNKSTVQSTSKTTGALRVDGGVGIGKNLTVGGNVSVTSDFTLGGKLKIIGSNANVTSNLQITGSNTYVNSDLITLKGENFVIDNNTHFKSLTDSDSPTTGSLIIDGGVGIGLDTNIGGNLQVLGNIHAIGNIIAKGDIQLGDHPFDTVSLIGRIDADIIPAQNQVVSIGQDGLVFANGFFRDAYIKSNVDVSNSLLVRGKRARFQANTEAVGPNLTVSANSIFSGDNFKVYGQNAHLTSNITIDSISTRINSNILLSGNTTVSNVVFSGKFTNVESNTEFNSSYLNINSNVNITNYSTIINSDVNINGELSFGQNGSSNNIIIYGNTTGEKIKYDATREELILNTKLITNIPVETENSLTLSNNHSIIFKQKFIQQDSNSIEGKFLTEDGNDLFVLEDSSTDGIFSTEHGLNFRSKNFLMGVGEINTGYGSSGILILNNGRIPYNIANLPIGQSHLYSKQENIKNSNDQVVANGSYFHTLSNDGYETVLGIHNSDGDLELMSRNLSTGQTYRLNIFELARVVETLNGQIEGTYLKEE